MPDHGFGGCDGHHEIVDLRLRKDSPRRLQLGAMLGREKAPLSGGRGLRLSRGRVGTRREDAFVGSSKSGAPLPTRWMGIGAWAKSRAGDARRRYAGDFAHPTHLLIR